MIDFHSVNLKEITMPNIKSSIKRVSVNEKKREENKSIKSRLRTSVKKLKALIAENKIEEAKEYFKEVVSLLDKAASDNVIHKNRASKKQAQFAKMLSEKSE